MGGKGVASLWFGECICRHTSWMPENISATPDFLSRVHMRGQLMHTVWHRQYQGRWSSKSTTIERARFPSKMESKGHLQSWIKVCMIRHQTRGIAPTSVKGCAHQSASSVVTMNRARATGLEFHWCNLLLLFF